jgi:hypothetical protein
MITQKREVEELEGKARLLIAEIIPLLGSVKEDALPDVSTHLRSALETAQGNLEEAKTGRRVRKTGTKADEAVA